MYPKNDPDKSEPSIPKNLLIVRTDRIGDVVLSLPLAQIVKKYFPECRITFLIRDYTKSIVQNHPFIDDHIILQERANKISLINNIKKIRGRRFDSAIIVYPTFITALIIFLSGIKNRIGTGYRWYSFFFNKKVFEHRKYAERHELEYNVNLLKMFGINETINFGNVEFNLPVDPISKEKIDKIFLKNNIDQYKPVIIIHPGSGGSSIDLPIEKLKVLIEMILEKLNAEIILSGTRSEKHLCDELTIRQPQDKRINNFAGNFNLTELTALIDKCRIFISNSTGPIHIAAALGKYTIGFYPKIPACSAERWGPYTNKRAIFKPEIDCTNCTREQCNKLDCMSSIKVTDIFAQVEKFYQIALSNGDSND